MISVSDDVIPLLARSLSDTKTIVVHTSGTRSIDVLIDHQKRGVFYPLQTFSKQTEMLLKNVPFCIEANSKETEQVLVG